MASGSACSVLTGTFPHPAWPWALMRLLRAAMRVGLGLWQYAAGCGWIFDCAGREPEGLNDDGSSGPQVQRNDSICCLEKMKMLRFPIYLDCSTTHGGPMAEKMIPYLTVFGNWRPATFLWLDCREGREEAREDVAALVETPIPRKSSGLRNHRIQ